MQVEPIGTHLHGFAPFSDRGRDITAVEIRACQLIVCVGIGGIPLEKVPQLRHHRLEIAGMEIRDL